VSTNIHTLSEGHRQRVWAMQYRNLLLWSHYLRIIYLICSPSYWAYAIFTPVSSQGIGGTERCKSLAPDPSESGRWPQAWAQAVWPQHPTAQPCTGTEKDWFTAQCEPERICVQVRPGYLTATYQKNHLSNFTIIRMWIAYSLVVQCPAGYPGPRKARLGPGCGRLAY
jgi:hypothetical protein